MVYPATGSTLQPNISTTLSTQIVIKVGTVTVGAIQRLNWSQNRSLFRVPEVGTDGIIEIVPNQATQYQAEVQRIAFDRLRLTEAFGRGFVNIKSQLIPFETLIIDRTNGEEEGLVTHSLINCWFNVYSGAYEANNYIVTEQGTMWFEDIATTLGTSDSNAANGGARGINFQVNERERATDRGAGGATLGAGFRGTLDVANLINQTFE